MPWFTWRGRDSRDVGLWVSELPAPRRAAERHEEVTIPGRAGSLHLKEGENVHEGYVRECRVTARADADYADILTWLSGSGEVIFSNEPDRVYDAEIIGEVLFNMEGNTLKKAMIPFYVNPHKRQYPPEPAVTFDADGTIYNPGTVAARPKVTITFTGTCTVSIGGSAMTFTAKPLLPPPENTITVDCEAEVITDDEGIWDGASSGEYWEIPTGSSAVEVTDAEITILPRWRWF